MPGHYGRSSSSGSSGSSGSKGSPHSGGGGGWSPGVGGQQHQPKKKTSTWSPGVGGQQHIPKKKTSTWTPGAGAPTHIPKKKTTPVTTGGAGLPPQLGGPFNYGKFRKNTAKNTLWNRWQRHKMMSNLMKEGKLKDYHQLGAHDFTKRYNIPNWASKGLATLYQYGSELGRQFIPVNQNNIYTALGEDLRKDKPFEPLGAIVGSISDALGRAKEESRLGHLGIQGLTGPQQEIYNQYAKTWNPVLKTMYKANGGLIDLYRYGGFSG